MTTTGSMDNARAWITSRALTLGKRSWKLQVHGRERLDSLISGGDRLFLCFWHGKYVPILSVMRGIDGCVITSATRNGNIIARIVGDFGFDCIQIPDRGGHRSLRFLEKALLKVRIAGTAVDGPMGPYHSVKQGIIRLASGLGYQLLPISVDARHKYVVKHRWDLMEIPMPFTRVCLLFGDPITVPASMEPEMISAKAVELTGALESLDERAASVLSDKQGY